jgi:hypothetical protein
MSWLAEERSRLIADVFDRRIVTLLAFGPATAVLALMAATGRGAVAMWGYPLWLFVGLWIVLFEPNQLDSTRVKRVVGTWAAVLAAFAIAFVLNYTELPSLDRRYRAELFPGDKLAAELTQRFHFATGGKKLRYVIGSMWVAGNVAHYSPDHPKVLIDGLPRRSPWIDLDDLRSRGAIAVWNLGDLEHVPAQIAAIAPTVEIGPPLALPARRFGSGVEHFGWGILKPK